MIGAFVARETAGHVARVIRVAVRHEDHISGSNLLHVGRTHWVLLEKRIGHYSLAARCRDHERGMPVPRDARSLRRHATILCWSRATRQPEPCPPSQGYSGSAVSLSGRIIELDAAHPDEPDSRAQEAHRRSAARAEARLAQGARAGFGELPAAEGIDANARAAYGVRRSELPEHRRVLASRHRDVHDPRRHVHAIVRLLQCHPRHASRARPAGARPRRQRNRRRWSSRTS